MDHHQITLDYWLFWKAHLNLVTEQLSEDRRIIRYRKTAPSTRWRCPCMRGQKTEEHSMQKNCHLERTSYNQYQGALPLKCWQHRQHEYNIPVKNLRVVHDQTNLLSHCSAKSSLLCRADILWITELDESDQQCKVAERNKVYHLWTLRECQVLDFFWKQIQK